MATNFKEGKGSLFLTIFGIIFLGLSIWVLNAPKADASVYLGCAQESTCGWIDTDKSALFCESSKWCMINPYVPSPLVGYGFPASCSDSNNNRYCQENGCYDTGAANGADCTVVVGAGGMTGGCGSNTKISGKWDASKKQCIVCSGNKEQSVCGTTSAILTSGSSCTGTGDGNLESACSSAVVAACDDQAIGATCNGTGICQSDGTCLVVGALTLAVNPENITVNTSSSLEFTVTDGTNVVSAANVAISGLGLSGSCNTDASGKCSITVTPALPGTATATATKSPLAPGSASILVVSQEMLTVSSSINTVASGVSITPIFTVANGSTLLNNMTVTLSGGFSGSCNTGFQPGKCSAGVVSATSEITVIASDPNGVYADSFAIKITVTGGNTSGNCSSMGCGAINTTVPCSCGTASADSANPWCCAAKNQIFSDKNACTAVCSPATGQTCSNNTREGTEVCDGTALAGKTCITQGFTGGTLSCNADCNSFNTSGCTGNTPVIPSGSACSGEGMYDSPLTYCKIEELIAAATNWILGIASSIIILVLIFGGITYITSAGDEDRIKTAKNTILYAVIGLAIILLAYTMINEVKDILQVISSS